MSRVLWLRRAGGDRRPYGRSFGDGQACFHGLNDPLIDSKRLVRLLPCILPSSFRPETLGIAYPDPERSAGKCSIGRAMVAGYYAKC
jgi:hypothetical protein